MQGWVEQAIRNLTQRVEYLYREIPKIWAQMNNMRQQLLAAYQASGSGTGGQSNVYYCVPGANIPAASSAPGTGPPGVLTGQTIYQLASGSYTTVTTNGTVYNGYLNAFASGKVATVLPNGDGTYSAIGQSCT